MKKISCKCSFTKAVMLNSFQHLHLNHPLFKAEEILNQVQDDNRHGFTLIELLVVVLIIGILAAVAVPQYQVTVMKSRTINLLPLMKAVEDAEHVYRLASGEFTTDFAALDIEMPSGGSVEEETLAGGAYRNKLVFNNFTCFLQDASPSQYSDQNISLICQYQDTNGPEIERYFSRNYWICWGPGLLSGKVCKTIAGGKEANSTSPSRGGKVGYSFSGTK